MMQPQVGYAKKSDVLRIAYPLSNSGSAHIGWNHAAQGTRLILVLPFLYISEFKGLFLPNELHHEREGMSTEDASSVVGAGNRILKVKA